MSMLSKKLDTMLLGTGCLDTDPAFDLKAAKCTTESTVIHNYKN